MDELKMFGHKARLVLELPDGEHDVSNCVELVMGGDDAKSRTGFWVNTERLLNEVVVETRTRARLAERR